MSDTRPPWPGPEPEPFEFPFDAARQARQQAEDLAGDLTTAKHDHQDQRDHLEAGEFSGSAADRFRGRFDTLLDDLAGHIGALEAQVDMIAAQEGIASRKVEERAAEQRSWQHRHDAWASWEPSTTGS